MKKHYLHIEGQAIVDVTYNYEILDLEKFREVLKNKRDDLYDIQDLWAQGILDVKTPIIQFVNVDYNGTVEDTSYTEINGSSSEVEQILYENNIEGLDEYYQ